MITMWSTDCPLPPHWNLGSKKSPNPKEVSLRETRWGKNTVLITTLRCYFAWSRVLYVNGFNVKA